MASIMIEKFINRFKVDGEDHIRISAFAATQLGKMLAQDWRRKFSVPHLGDFLTPACFVNWVTTGDDNARHNPKFRVTATIKHYKPLLMYAKFYQLVAMKAQIAKEMKDLPFAMYREHPTSGVKEFDRWTDYPSDVKDMANHIIDQSRGADAPYPWEEKFPGLVKKLNQLVGEITGNKDVDVMAPVTPKPPKQPKKQQPSAKSKAKAAENISRPPIPGEVIADLEDTVQTHTKDDLSEDQVAPQPSQAEIIADLEATVQAYSKDDLSEGGNSEVAVDSAESGGVVEGADVTHQAQNADRIQTAA